MTAAEDQRDLSMCDVNALLVEKSGLVNDASLVAICSRGWTSMTRCMKNSGAKVARVVVCEATPITLGEAFQLELRLSREHVKSAYFVPDAAVDGFRVSW